MFSLVVSNFLTAILLLQYHNYGFAQLKAHCLAHYFSTCLFALILHCVWLGETSPFELHHTHVSHLQTLGHGRARRPGEGGAPQAGSWAGKSGAGRLAGRPGPHAVRPIAIVGQINSVLVENVDGFGDDGGNRLAALLDSHALSLISASERAWE